MTPSTNTRQIMRGLLLLIGGVCIWLIYTIIASLHVAHTTGILTVQSSDSNAILSVSSQNTTASIIGTGSARVRLKAGIYLLYSVHTGKNAAKVIHISTRQTTTVHLDLNTPPLVPSVSNIIFKGTDSFLNRGLSDVQINNFKRLMFNYKQTIHTVAIDTNSVASAPHNPDDPNFTLNFNLLVDGTRYKGSMTYSDFTDIQLTLSDTTSGSQIYNASSMQTTPDS